MHVGPQTLHRSANLDPVCLASGWLLVLICSERKLLLAGGWFVLIGKYCRLVTDKLDKHGVSPSTFVFESNFFL
jgi:hypothetical protein